MKFPVLWSGLDCYTVKCTEILAHIELPYNPRINKVFTFTKHKYSSFNRVSCIVKDPYAAFVTVMLGVFTQFSQPVTAIKIRLHRIN